jgi:hypothetical protein
MSSTLETKDPADVKDYAIEWAEVLTAETDTLSTSAWSTSEPTGLTVATAPPPAISGTKTIVWVSGGIPNTKYVLTNTVTTAGGRTHERSITIPCLQR